MKLKLTRRRLVGWGLGLLGLAAAGRWALRGRRSDAEVLVRELVRQVAVPDPVAAGRAYLAATPAETDSGALAGRVLAGLPLAGTAREVRRAFRDRLAADFRAGRTVQADGWYLSRTEARLCALVALETAPPGLAITGSRSR